LHNVIYMPVAIYSFTVQQSSENDYDSLSRPTLAVNTLHRKPDQMRNILGKEWSETDTPKPVKLEASGSKRLSDVPLYPPSDRTVINECFEANKPRN